MNIINNEIDIFMISEIKIHTSFPISKFTMPGYLITSHGGEILFFSRDYISCKKIKMIAMLISRGFCGEKFKEKWLFCCSYNHMKVIRQTILKAFFRYWTNLMQLTTILLGDVNVEPEDESIAEFLNLYNLKNLVKQKTCFRTPDKHTCIDVILTICPRSFQNADTFERGLSDFH